MNIEIPAGLTELLQDFTVSVLRERPGELVAFAADYFNGLNEKQLRSKQKSSKGSVSFPTGRRDEPMQTEVQSDDEIDFEPPNLPDRNERRKSVAAERYDPEADEDETEKVVHPKSDVQRLRLAEAVKDILIFRSLDAQQMQEVIDAMFERKVGPEDHVIDQGDDGDNFYVIDTGRYETYVETKGVKKMVAQYTDKGSFGELALMYNVPRAATVIAKSTGTLWAMNRATFRRIVLKSAFNKRKMYLTLIDNVSLLKSLDTYERMSVADALVSKTFHNGELIIKQGTAAEYMYFVEDGEVKITMSKMSEPEVELTRIRKGGCFGELALVKKEPRAASAYAVGTVTCAVLDVFAFERLLGPCMEIMKRNFEDYEKQTKIIFGAKGNETR